MTKFQKQVEVQGTKKLGSVKGVQVLELNEMKETEGGGIFAKILGFICGVIYSAGDSPDANPYAPHRKL